MSKTYSDLDVNVEANTQICKYQVCLYSVNMSLTQQGSSHKLQNSHLTLVVSQVTDCINKARSLSRYNV